MIDLSGDHAFITGASGGIGKAITKQLHQLGAHVYISGSNLEKLELLGQELEDNYTIKQSNLSQTDTLSTIFDGIQKLDILVCNAGITRDNLALRMSDKDFQDVLNVNLTASFILNKLAIKSMMRNKYGRIINISSVVGISGNPGQANYCASKAGLIGMTKALAMEVATRGITINTVAPGFIQTNMTNALTDEQKDAIMKKIPSRTLGRAEDVANVVSFLASECSSYITGQTLHINGGLLMV